MNAQKSTEKFEWQQRRLCGYHIIAKPSSIIPYTCEMRQINKRANGPMTRV